MKLIVDYANLEKIKEMYMYYPVDGVTTNPSILAKEKRKMCIRDSKISFYIPIDILTVII